MITVNDFVICQVPPEIQIKSIDYAGRSINFTYDRMGYADVKARLFRIVVGIVIEKTFENYLQRMKFSYDTRGRTHWRNIDRAEFLINREYVDIKGYHVYPSKDRKFPEWFLDTEGLLPYGQYKDANAADICMQAFLVAPQVNSSSEHYYIAILPKVWCNLTNLPAPITITLPISSQNNFKIILSGEDKTGNDLSESLTIEKNILTYQTINYFSSLEYITIDNVPNYPITLQTVRQGQTITHVINSTDWFDMWLQNPSVYFTGWGTKKDYKQGIYLDKNTKTKVYTGGTKTANYSLLIKELRPIAELLKST